ncbi:MAG TPA: hypothetical protein VHR42_00110, partial [Clostridia bacterium]|nr:hypothetical protein [Clostridia bacterium]
FLNKAVFIISFSLTVLAFIYGWVSGQTNNIFDLIIGAIINFIIWYLIVYFVFWLVKRKRRDDKV